MKYLLLLVLCLAGCGKRTFDQTVISESKPLLFNASVEAVKRDVPPVVVVVKLDNGGLYSLIEPFDKTDAGVPLEPDQTITVEYVKKYKTDIQGGRVFQTTPADPAYEIRKVTAYVPPALNYNELFK